MCVCVLWHVVYCGMLHVHVLHVMLYLCICSYSMCVCFFICMYICLCMSVCVCASVCVHICTCICLYSVYAWNLHVCACVYVSVCVCACVCACVCIRHHYHISHTLRTAAVWVLLIACRVALVTSTCTCFAAQCLFICNSVSNEKLGRINGMAVFISDIFRLVFKKKKRHVDCFCVYTAPLAVRLCVCVAWGSISTHYIVYVLCYIL